MRWISPRSWVSIIPLIAMASACRPDLASMTASVVSSPKAPATSVPMPHPSPIDRDHDPVAINRACEGCHPAIAQEWRDSLHAQAHTDPAYQRALAIEPLPFCRSCHAPEADHLSDPPAPLGELGVGCVTCHVTEDNHILATPNLKNTISKTPHPVFRAADFATASACAHCHEFPFPGSRSGRPRELMQSTISEHRKGSYANVSCASCHMPTARDAQGHGHRSHRFVSSRDAAFIRSAVNVRALRTASGLDIHLDPQAVGHAFPTGDLFRRVEVLLEVVGAEEQVLFQDRRMLTRRFDIVQLPDGNRTKVLSEDTRVHGPTVLSFPIDAALANFPVRYSVTYQRVEHPVGASDENAVVEGEVLVAGGEIVP